MNYNIIYSTNYSVGAKYLFALDEKMFNDYLSAYNNGKETFFHRGKEILIHETHSVTVYDCSIGLKDISANILYAKLKEKFSEIGYHIYGVEKTFKSIGNDVTEDFIKGPYGNLKKEKANKTELLINSDNYINENRTEELKEIDKSKFDLTKLLRLCTELNSSNQNENWFAVGALVRAIIDHVPPIFGCKSFSEVANNYSSPGKAKSFKDSMDHLEKSMRKITDSFLHSHITKSETLPNEQQVDCKRDLDRLLEEIVRILKT